MKKRSHLKKQPHLDSSTNLKYIIIAILVVIIIIGILFYIGYNKSSPTSIILTQLNNVTSFSPGTHSFTLQPDEYQAVKIVVPQNSSPNYVYTRIDYSMTSNVSVNTALLTKNEFESFNKTQKSSIYVQSGTKDINAIVTNSSVVYYLVVYSYNKTAMASLTFNVTNVSSENGQAQFYGGSAILNRTGLRFSLPTITAGSPSEFAFTAAANQSFIYELINDSTNSTVFSSPQITITNITGSVSNHTDYYEYNLSSGKYFIKIVNPNGNSTYFHYGYVVVPQYVNPFTFNQSASAIGLASYGVSNGSKKLSEYTIATTALQGFANISSLYAYSSSQSLQSHSVSLQLNGVLLVENKDNSTFTYWIQDTAEINTQTRTIYFVDNVWNESVYAPESFTLTNKSITGNGYVSYSNSSSQAYYASATNSSYFGYPLAFSLEMTESVDNNSGVNISECYQPITGNSENSSLLDLRTGCYDEISISDPNIESAAFYITGDSYPLFNFPRFYDAELVFGGGYNSSYSTIQSSDVKLSLLYWNTSSGAYTPFPSYYSFSGDTGEAINNLNSAYNGLYATESAGTSNLVNLGKSNEFLPLITVNNVNFTYQINFPTYSETNNYSEGTLPGFSTNGGNYYSDNILTPSPYTQYLCTLNNIESTTPQVYLTAINITLPYTFPQSTANIPLTLQFYTPPLYNYTGNLQVLEDWTCS